MQDTQTQLRAVTPPDGEKIWWFSSWFFYTSSKVIKWKPMSFLVPGPMECLQPASKHCPLSLHPNIQMYVINSWDSEKALLKVLSACKSRLPWVQQTLTPITKLSPCPLIAQIIQLRWKQKGNESKETLMHLTSRIWELPFLQANLPTNNRPYEQHPGTHLAFSVSRGKFSLMRPWLRRRRDSAFMSELKISPAMMWRSASCTFRTIFKLVVLSRVCKGTTVRI